MVLTLGQGWAWANEENKKGTANSRAAKIKGKKPNLDGNDTIFSPHRGAEA